MFEAFVVIAAIILIGIGAGIISKLDEMIGTLRMISGNTDGIQYIADCAGKMERRS